ncbi:MAG TPA: GNAT family N-acetyltransferase [Pilimelia sp.]|nr:GNAT family N-acetyltransferase [Pilimelia sp.]
MIDRRLRHHLTTWLGQWPAGQRLQVVGSTRREEPGWDGQVHPAIGVGAPDQCVLSVAPQWTAAVRELAVCGCDRLLANLAATVGFPERGVYRAVFRWTIKPAALPEVGVWLPADDPLVPPWLRVFGGEVLVAADRDTGEYLAGLGIKRHDPHGHELSVGTAPDARGRGLARRLVAQAARRVLDEGAVPTYLHGVTNAASARVADAAGLPDRGWTSFGVAEPN